MRYKFILLAFVAIVATAWAAHSATPDPAVAQTVTNAQLQSEVNVLNELINMDYSVWAAPGKYDQLRKNRRYRKIAWAQDGCSAPYQTIADVLDSIILPVCLRHDMTWRSLAVIDRATGKVWNNGTGTRPTRNSGTMPTASAQPDIRSPTRRTYSWVVLEP